MITDFPLIICLLFFVCSVVKYYGCLFFIFVVSKLMMFTLCKFFYDLFQTFDRQQQQYWLENEAKNEGNMPPDIGLSSHCTSW